MTQIQPKSQFLFHKNLPPRDFSIMTLNASTAAAACSRHLTPPNNHHHLRSCLRSRSFSPTTLGPTNFSRLLSNSNFQLSFLYRFLIDKVELDNAIFCQSDRVQLGVFREIYGHSIFTKCIWLTLIKQETDRDRTAGLK